MLFAAVRIAPPDGRLTGFAREAMAQAPGVRHVTARDGWIAVVADSWWAAEHALKAEQSNLLRHAYARGFAAAVRRRAGEWRRTRMVQPRRLRNNSARFASACRHLLRRAVAASWPGARDRDRATSGGALEVWAPTQAPGFARAPAGALYPMPVGEPAGRALEADAVPIAVELARELKRPVQVTLSQSEGQKHDRAAPGALARMTALPGEGGITAAWQMRVATADGLGSALARLDGTDAPEKLGPTALDGAVPPYGIPHVRIEAVHAPLPFPAGYMRGSPQRELTFFTESFIDELARAAGMEPLAFRMSMLGGNGRLARCLQGAARLAEWDGGGPGSTMGIAGCSAYGSHIGLVATASIGDDQRIKVHRLVQTEGLIGPVSDAIRAHESKTGNSRSGRCGLSGEAGPLVQDKFPQPNLPVLGRDAPSARNKDTPANSRYGRSAADTMPVGERNGDPDRCRPQSIDWRG